MSMGPYLFAQVQSATEVVADKPWLSVAGAALIHQAQHRYGDFLLSDPVWLVTACWAADFVLGTVHSLSDSWKAWRATPEERTRLNIWSPRRVGRSVGKWLLWMVVLFVCYCLRSSGRFGFGPFASLIEAAIILSECTSAIRNAARINGAKWLERFANAGERGIDRLAERAESSVPPEAQVSLSPHKQIQNGDKPNAQS